MAFKTTIIPGIVRGLRMFIKGTEKYISRIGDSPSIYKIHKNYTLRNRSLQRAINVTEKYHPKWEAIIIDT